MWFADWGVAQINLPNFFFDGTKGARAAGTTGTAIVNNDKPHVFRKNLLFILEK
jgi:hypothetical protein